MVVRLELNECRGEALRAINKIENPLTRRHPPHDG